MSRTLVEATSLLTMMLLATSLGSAVAAGSHHRIPTQAAARPNPQGPPRPTLGACTMAVPALHATVEAQIANAADFCELVSQALAVEVFGSSVIVTPDRLWHYADAALSCHLRYGRTRYRMTIRNSAAACRWLMRRAPSWRVEAAGTE